VTRYPCKVCGQLLPKHATSCPIPKRVADIRSFLKEHNSKLSVRVFFEQVEASKEKASS